MSSLLRLCLSLLSVAVLSAQARPQPQPTTGVQGNANNGQHHDSAKESDDSFRRVFKLSTRGRPATNYNTTTTTNNTKSLSPVVDDVDTSPSTYATMILELLPIIREGYRNNAFNDVDKTVIRRIFGDMKIVMDEEVQTPNLKPVNYIPLGDQTTIIGDVIDNRHKRFKEDYNQLKNFVDNIPNQLKGKFIFTSDKLSKLHSSRSPPGPEAAAVLALLAENDSHVVLEPENDEEDEEYDEYYEYEDEEEEEEDEDDDEDGIHDYENGSFADLIKLAAKHKLRKAKEGQ